MPIIRADVAIAGASNLPEDESHNVFHFDVTGPTPDSGEIADMAEALTLFYIGNDGGAVNALTTWYSTESVDVTPSPIIRFYELPAVPGPVGSPIAEANVLGFTASSADALPHEVALALTFHADLTGIPESVPGGVVGPEGDTHPRARRRGRIYLGPLNVNTVDGTSGRPSASFRTSVAAAGVRLRDNLDLQTGGIQWVVFSPTDWVARPVVNGWVDNAFDTQRRRGVAASSRTTW